MIMDVMARFGYIMVWYGMVLYGVVWYGVVWFGYNIAWYGMVWYGWSQYDIGMVWYGAVVIMDHKNIALLSTSSSYPPILTLFCAQYCFISHTLFFF